MDKCTFGDSQASVNLMCILGQPEYSVFEKKVCRILSKYIEETKVLVSIPHKEVRVAALNMWRDRFKKRVEGSGFPDIIRTHINCVIVGYFRKRIKGV